MSNFEKIFLNHQRVKYFLQQLIGVSLFRGVVIATKIKPGENLILEIFCHRKISQSLVLAIKENKTKNETAKIL